MKKAVKITLIILFWVAIWWIASLIIGNILLFPDPLTVLLRLFQLLLTSDFWISLLTSLFRVMIGIIIAIILGALLAFISARLRIVHDLLFPLMTVMKSTPVASFVILIVLFIGKDIVPSIISLLMVLPVIWTNVYEGLCNVDKDLVEVCTVYKFTRFKRFRVLYLPSVLPYLTASILSSIGLGWKAGIAAEILYPPLKSIGRAILDSKQLFITEDLYAWTLVVIILSLLFESSVKISFKLASQRRKGGKSEN